MSRKSSLLVDRPRLADHDEVTSMNSLTHFRTLKAAREAGYKEIRAGYYGGDQIVVKGRTLSKNQFRAKSRTEWCRLGYTVPDDVEPHGLLFGRRFGHYEVFRHDQVGASVGPVMREAKREARAADEKAKRAAADRKREREREQRAADEALEWLIGSCSELHPVKVPLLAALQAVNRHAKRARDLRRGGGFWSKEHEEKIYLVKGQALHWLLEERQLVVCGYHLFRNYGYGIWESWAELLEGDGYRFHRPCDQARCRRRCDEIRT